MEAVASGNWPRLDGRLVRAILDVLECRGGSPSLRRLGMLVRGYVRTVPWESASRIVKRRATTLTTGCPRWPEEFWADALSRGAGGTCFESNYAFFALLNSLGYEGYLTINDMGTSAGCHTAIIIRLHPARLLVDVGLPVYAPLPIEMGRVTRRRSLFHTYTVRPQVGQRYRIERSRHPQRDMFTLVDRPVTRDEYEAAVADDYGEAGYFLDRVIISKVIDNSIYRFNGGEQPYRLERFDQRGKAEVPLLYRDAAGELAGHFGIERSIIAAALSLSSKGRL